MEGDERSQTQPEEVPLIDDNLFLRANASVPSEVMRGKAMMSPPNSSAEGVIAMEQK